MAPPESAAVNTHDRAGPEPSAPSAAASGLSQRTAAGSAWLLSSRLLQQGLMLLQITILARLLDPMAFGLIGLANLATVAIGVFLFTGFEAALIQKSNLQDVDLDTAWWVTLGRYVLIGVILVLLAGPIAALYHTPEAVPVILAFALIQPILGLTSPSMILFRRQIDFRKVATVDVVSAVIGLVVGIPAALLLHDVWALVLAYLATNVTLVLLSYTLHPYRPRRRFSRASLHRLTSYGQWMLGSAVLVFVATQSSSAFSGWMFGMAALGAYQMAARFAALPSTQLGEAIQSALMPAYASIQEDKARVSHAFLRALALTTMLIVGTTAVIALGLPRLLVLVLGAQWSQAAVLLPTIAIASGTQAMLRTSAPLYLGTGQPRLQFHLDLVQAIITVALLYPLGRLLGLQGLPLAALAGALSTVPVWWHGIHQSTCCSGQSILKSLLPPAIGTIVMAGLLYLGTIPVVPQPGLVVAILWQIIWIGIGCLGFLVTIGVCQSILPHYTPLAELRTFAKRQPYSASSAQHNA